MVLTGDFVVRSSWPCLRFAFLLSFFFSSYVLSTPTQSVGLYIKHRRILRSFANSRLIPLQGHYVLFPLRVLFDILTFCTLALLICFVQSASVRIVSLQLFLALSITCLYTPSPTRGHQPCARSEAPGSDPEPPQRSDNHSGSLTLRST